MARAVGAGRQGARPSAAAEVSGLPTKGDARRRRHFSAMSAIGPKQTCRKTQSTSLLGAKRTCLFAVRMSAFDPKRTVTEHCVKAAGCIWPVDNHTPRSLLLNRPLMQHG